MAGKDLHISIGALNNPVWHLLGLLANLACLATDETLDGEEGVLWVHHGLALGDLSNQAVTALGEGHHGGGGAATLGVGDDRGLASLHRCHSGVGGSQIDAHHLLCTHSHSSTPRHGHPPARDLPAGHRCALHRLLEAGIQHLECLRSLLLYVCCY
mmetsp:Transcript_4580/g.12510  ORF Transcript_4580/g.12510 Transcript_4580/m.12510 type:complete len:156 (-) Transcript_4580:74-541(-)